MSEDNFRATDSTSGDADLLGDVTVAEVGSSEAVGWCGRVLSDLGARVSRYQPNDAADDAYSAYLHRSKGRLDTATRVDILVVDGNDNRGLTDAFTAHNSELVVASISDYGITGPDAKTPASELTLQSEAGIVAVHPTYKRPPTGVGVNLAEQLAGRWAAIGALAGLIEVARGGRGTQVDVSRFESLISVLQYPWLMAQFADSFPYPVPQMAVPGIEPAKDGWVCVVAVSPQQWSAFKQLASDPCLDDPRFDLLIERIRLVAEVRPLVHDFTKRHTVAELVEMGIANRIPIAPVNTPGTASHFGPYADRDRIDTRISNIGFPRSPVRVQADSSAIAVPTAVRLQGDPRRPLSGVRVAELASYQAGPLVGSYLGALGADVIRVESANKPDVMRLAGTAPTVDRFWERGAPFAGVNYEKRSITAELADPRGREIVERLIASSHVLVENNVPRVLDSRGLNYEGVRALQPTIVMTRMPAWGSTGPWRDQPGFTYTANAASGISWMTGYPDDEPLLSSTMFDPMAAIAATAGTLAAIHRWLRTGLGAHIEVALGDVALEASAPHIVSASLGERPVRSGNRREGIAPQGIYRTADEGWIAISATSDDQWRALAQAPGMPERATDPRLSSIQERVDQHDELDEMLCLMCLQHHARSLVGILRKLGIPAAEVKVGTDLIHHPQLLARQRVYTLDHPVVGSARYIGPPTRFSHAPAASAGRPAPLFGQHSRELLLELGYTEDEINALDTEGALARSPFGLPFQQPNSVPQH